MDGLKFKDMNKNGTLDVYEDWRVDTDARIADLIAQLTPEEEVGLLFCVNTQLVDAVKMVQEYALTCQLFNLNGTPETITNTLNNLQAAAEAERLAVPMVITSDREYNAFGGYIDKAHEAFGTANDPELAYELACYYGKAMRAVGIHVTFEPYANEIGAQYGENPEYIASIVHEEIRGLEENGLASCTKHWIGRGGDSSFGKARSVAQNFDNWMVGWTAALSAGSEWVMTNCGGIINKEIARDALSDDAQWKDLAGDQGAPAYVRLIVQALMEDDPNHASPNNYGDPLVTYQFGMSYGQDPDFKYSCLILPITQEVREEEGSSGSINTVVYTTNVAKAGEPFTVYALLRNNGADGFTIAQATANGEVVAEKIMTVEGGSWRVLQMDLTLEAGEYNIEVGGLTGTITVTE